MSYQIKNVLVTGAAGFIGCNFVRYLLRYYKHIQIVSFDKLTYAGFRSNLPDDSRNYFIQGDILNRPLIKQILNAFEVDTIVHFAAETHVDRSIITPNLFIETNIIGTFNLLEEARFFWLNKKNWTSSECRFHHISTDEVYGQLSSDDPPFSEVSPYKPRSPYSASKASADHLVRVYYNTYKLPVTISNCSNNYGPYQHQEKLIPTIINSCLNEQPIPIYGNGLNVRDWLYVEDHCSAIDVILKNGIVSETYNIGGSCELTNLALVLKICKILDQRCSMKYPYRNLLTFVTDRPGHDQRYAINSSKIRLGLKWKTKYNLDDGLQKTLNFYYMKKNIEMESRIKQPLILEET